MENTEFPGTISDPKSGALAGERYRVLVDSDIGGCDPDDFQSIVHLLLYADMFDLEGLVAGPPNPQGTAKDFLEAIEQYELDYPNLVQHSDKYPTPDLLRSITKDGALDPVTLIDDTTVTEGSDWIIACANKDDEARPLYILEWGSITNIAQALHDDPSIADKIRVISIGSWNTEQDTYSRNYIYRHFSQLWWVESDTTFRGMYVGGNQSGDLDNSTFIEEHVKNHGHLGDYLYSKKSTLKMGDTPTVLYLLRGNPEDPTSEHWGGSYIRNPHGTNYWKDNPDPTLAEGIYNGAKTINKWRENYLRDWQDRIARVF